MTAPVKERRPEAAPAAPVRPVRLGPRDVTVDRRRDGTIHLTSPHALAPYPAKLTERLEHWAATAPERIFLAQRDAAGGWRKLTYARDLGACSPHRRGAAATRAVARAADRDPVRQRHRACAARPRRDVCRHSVCADLAGLFADLAGFRQAPSTSSTCSRRVSSSPPTASPTARDRGGGAARRRGRRRPQPIAGPAEHAAADIAGDAHDFGGRRRARRGRAGHHRQVPVHLGLDRHAESA